MSAQLLQYTVDTCNIDISQEQLQFVQHAISGGSSSSADWRFQVVWVIAAGVLLLVLETDCWNANEFMYLIF